MTLLSTGHHIWPTDSIISKATRKWLGIDDVVCTGITANDRDSVLSGTRKFANLSDQEQWLSMHQCIDVACPIHGNDNYSKSPLPVNDYQACYVPDGDDEHLLRYDTYHTPCSETTTCRRQLFGEDDRATTGCGNQQTLGYGTTAVPRDTDAGDLIPVQKPIYALQQIAQNYNDRDSLGELTTHKLSERTYNSPNPSYNIASKENRPITKPRFMCTWLHDNVSMDKYPLYKLSIVCANTVPVKRKEFGVFSTHVTDQLWSSYKCNGEMDIERFDKDETPTSSCRKSKSIESCVNETTVSVLKDISDVDISDLKMKYNFLFDPKYIFKATDSTEHAGGAQTVNRPNDNRNSKHSKTGSHIVTGLPANGFVNGCTYDLGCINNPSYLPLGLSNIPVHQQNHSNDSPRFENRIHTPSPVITYGPLNNPDKVTVNFNSLLADPRVHRIDVETNGLNDKGSCRSVDSSPDMYRQREAQLLTENSKYKMYNEWYGYESEESPYNTLPWRSPASNVISPYVYTEHDVWTPKYRELKEPSSHDSPLNNGSLVSPRSPREKDLKRKQNYHRVGENGDHSPLIKRRQTPCQSPLVQEGYVTCYRDGQRFFQSMYKTGSNNEHGDSPLLSNFTRCPLDGKQQRAKLVESRSRSRSPNDKRRSTRDRGRSTRRDEMDDDFSIEKRYSSDSRRSNIRFQYDDRPRRTETNDLPSLRSDCKQENVQNGDEMLNPIPQYLMSDRYTTFSVYNKSPKNMSRGSLYDNEMAPSCGRQSSTNRHLKLSSRDGLSRSDSRSHDTRYGRKTDRQDISRDDYFTKDNKCKLKASEEYYAKDRQNRRAYRAREGHCKSWNSRSRSRSRSSNARRSETRTTTNTKSISSSRQFSKCKDDRYDLNFESSKSRSRSSREYTRSADNRRNGDYRVRR